MKLGLMQPYLFPYLGYFQLINAVDEYYLISSFQYIQQGYINRNQLRISPKSLEGQMFSFQVTKADRHCMIKERVYKDLEKDKQALMSRIERNYKKAPNYEQVHQLLKELFCITDANVARFNFETIKGVANYMGINTKICMLEDEVTDEVFWEKFFSLDKEERVIYICNYLKGDAYINAIGGTELYHRDTFKSHGIDLSFCKMAEDEEIPRLSIIDILMYYTKEQYQELLDKCVIE